MTEFARVESNQQHYDLETRKKMMHSVNRSTAALTDGFSEINCMLTQN